MFFSVSVYVILLGILEPVDTDYSGGGLRGWLRALSWASVHISALLWNGCQLRLLGCDNEASIPLSVLCGNVSISLWQEKSSLQFSPSFMSILFLPACRFYACLPCLLVCCLPQALLECWGEIKKGPRSEQVRVFCFFISMTFFLWVVNTRDKLRFDRGYSNSNPGLSRWPFKNMRFDGWV